MSEHETADLLNALTSLLEFLARSIANNRMLLAAVTAGQRPTDEQMAQLREQVEADERDFARFSLRLGQLQAMQRWH